MIKNAGAEQVNPIKDFLDKEKKNSEALLVLMIAERVIKTREEHGKIKDIRLTAMAIIQRRS